MFPQGRETVFSALQLSQKRSSSPHVHCILWGACCFGLEIQGAPLVGMGVSPGRGAVGTRGTLWPGSVQEALAGFLPPAGRAPLVPVLDAIYLAALLGLPTGFPADQEKHSQNHVLLSPAPRMAAKVRLQRQDPCRPPSRGQRPEAQRRCHPILCRFQTPLRGLTLELQAGGPGAPTVSGDKETGSQKGGHGMVAPISPGAALGPGRRCDDQVRFCRGWWLLWLAEAQRSAPDLCGETGGRPGHEQESIC